MKVLSLQSGTSVDGIDVALVKFTASGDSEHPLLDARVLAAETQTWPEDLRMRLLEFSDGARLDAGELTRLNTDAGRAFAAAAVTLSTQYGSVDLVVSHGQTVFHWVADGQSLGTLQLGEPAWIAEAVGAPVLSNLRSSDIAAGGQGAPLMGLFDHAWLGSRATVSGRSIASLNLGGIANLQIIDPAGQIRAFDTGPANGLIDAVLTRASGGVLAFDPDGVHAARGRVDPDVLAALCAHPFLTLPPPKSTGRETFTISFVDAAVQAAGTAPTLDDLVATLTQFTALTVADALRAASPQVMEVIASGGGVLNPALMAAISSELGSIKLSTSLSYGIDPAFKESLLFAFLGYLTWHQVPVDLSTGSARLAGSLTPGPSILDLPPRLLTIGGLRVVQDL